MGRKLNKVQLSCNNKGGILIMSLIFAAAINHNKIIIKSDGREVDANYNVISENSPKIMKMSEDLIIGFTGNTQYRAHIMTHLLVYFHDKGIWTPELCFNEALSCAKRWYDKPTGCTIIIAGKNKNGLFLRGISSDLNSMDFLNQPLPAIAILGAVEQELSFDAMYDRTLSFEENMNTYIIKTSEIGSTVNSQIFTEFMQLDNEP